MNSFQQIFAAQGGRANGTHNRVDKNNTQSSHGPAMHDIGIYEGDDEGLLVIDYDINPGLQSGIPPITTMMVPWEARFTLHKTTLQ